MSIRCILNATITKPLGAYALATAHVAWIDTLRHPHEAHGGANSNRMRILLLRALREGVTIVREEY